MEMSEAEELDRLRVMFRHVKILSRLDGADVRRTFDIIYKLPLMEELSFIEHCIKSYVVISEKMTRRWCRNSFSIILIPFCPGPRE